MELVLKNSSMKWRATQIGKLFFPIRQVLNPLAVLNERRILMKEVAISDIILLLFSNSTYELIGTTWIYGKTQSFHKIKSRLCTQFWKAFMSSLFCLRNDNLFYPSLFCIIELLTFICVSLYYWIGLYSLRALEMWIYMELWFFFSLTCLQIYFIFKYTRSK